MKKRKNKGLTWVAGNIKNGEVFSGGNLDAIKKLLEYCIICGKPFKIKKNGSRIPHKHVLYI